MITDVGVKTPPVPLEERLRVICPPAVIGTPELLCLCTIKLPLATPTVVAGGMAVKTNFVAVGAIIVKGFGGFEMPPAGEGLNTVTLAVPTLIISLPKIDAWRMVGEMKMVFLSCPFHRTFDVEINPVPLTTKLNAGPPAMAEVGPMEVITGKGLFDPLEGGVSGLIPDSTALTATKGKKKRAMIVSAEIFCEIVFMKL